MSKFARKYSDEQREAVVAAYLDRGIRPAKRVVELAAAGELTHAGSRLDAFEIGVNMVRDYARHHRRRRAGLQQGKLGELPHRDAIEAMRRRLLNLCEAEITWAEKKKRGNVEPEYLRQMSRALLELARLPAPTDKRVASPDTKDPETGKALGARGSVIAGPLLRAHRTEGTVTHSTSPTAPERPTRLDTNGDNASDSATTTNPNEPEPTVYTDQSGSRIAS